MVNKKYTAEDIKVLTDQEHVRKRLSVYAGNIHKTNYEIPLFKDDGITFQNVSFCPAAWKCINEVIDNSNDEFSQIKQRNKLLTINADPNAGKYTISDNGRGVPIEKHETGKHTPEVVFGSLRSGRNFDDGREMGVIGMNGMGSAITNFCSTDFKVVIQQNNKKYEQTFNDGGTSVSKPKITKSSSRETGTSIEFQLDHEAFDDVTIPEQLLENRAREIALTNPDVTVNYNGTTFRYKKGFDEIIKNISEKYYKFVSEGMEFYVIFDLYEGIDEKIFSWVNGSYLFEGGICNTQFLNAFYDKVINHLGPQAKRQKCEVTKNDVRQNLLVIGNLKISDPQYDSQSKTRLTGPNLRKEMNAMLDQWWNSFGRRNKDWLNQVVERAMLRHHSTANKKAVKDLKKNNRKKVSGLVDATSKNRSECQLIVTEGESAAGQLTNVRDPRTTASLPLRGKINNVYGITIAQLLKMGKVTDLLTAIGLIPGQKAIRSDLNYGKIVITTDSDPDGGNIFTLLVNLFFQFWPELFDPQYEPIVYRLVAPNIVVSKGNKRIHFPNREQYEKQKSKYKGWTVEYMKGLGSMVNEDWRMILSGETDTLIPIIDDGSMSELLRLLFSSDTTSRKQWLQAEESQGED